MNKGVCGEQINKGSSIPRLSNSDDNARHRIYQSAATGIANNKNGVLDYKNVLLSLTGEISSDCINRNDLTRQKKPDVSYMETTEMDDDEFILNMKRSIDKNYKMQNKENYNIRDLQSKSYLTRKKKSAFSDEDQKLIKKFKRSVDENKAPQKLQQSENDISAMSVSSNDYKSTASASQTTPVFALNSIDTNLRNTKQFLFEVNAQMQRNDQLITPAVTKLRCEEISETEVEQMMHYEMRCITPPRKN